MVVWYHHFRKHPHVISFTINGMQPSDMKHMTTGQPRDLAVTDRQKGVLYVLLQKMLLSFKPGGDPFTFLVKVGTYTSLSPRIACFSFGPQNSGLAGIIIICQAYDAILLAPQLKIQATKISRRFVPKSHAEWSGTLYLEHFSDRNRHIQTMCIYVACQFCVSFAGGRKNRRLFGENKRLLRHPSTSWLT